MRLDNLVGRTVPLSAVQRGGELLEHCRSLGDLHPDRSRGAVCSVRDSVSLGVGVTGVADAARHPLDLKEVSP